MLYNTSSTRPDLALSPSQARVTIGPGHINAKTNKCVFSFPGVKIP